MTITNEAATDLPSLLHALSIIAEHMGIAIDRWESGERRHTHAEHMASLGRAMADISAQISECAFRTAANAVSDTGVRH